MAKTDDALGGRPMAPSQLAAGTTAGVGLLALAVKLWLGWSSGLAVVYASGLHALAGLLYGLLTLGVLRAASAPNWSEMSAAEREYDRYTRGLRINLRRSEASVALVGSLVLLVVAYVLFQRALIAKPALPTRLPATIIGLVAVYYLTGFQARLAERIGRREEVPMLVASAFHARTDALATLLALGGVVLAALSLPGERYLAALIGLLLVADAAQLFVDAVRRLVGLDDQGPLSQMPFWERLSRAARGPLGELPMVVRWLLWLDADLSPADRRACVRLAWALVTAVYLVTCCHRVRLGEVGAVKVFGAYRGQRTAGLVFAPWPLVRVRIAPVDQLQRVTVGFETATSWASHAEQRPVGELLWETTDEKSGGLIRTDPAASKYLLGDTTMVEAHVALVYRVDARLAGRYLFAAEDPRRLTERALRQALQEAMVVRTLDAVLVENRASLEQEVAQRVQRELDPLRLGIIVDSVLIRSLHPPVEVLSSFVDVASAIEDAERARYEAEATARAAVTKAEGEAARSVNTGTAEKVKRLADAVGGTSEFRAVLQGAQTAPDATRARLAIESQERALTGRPKVILPRGSGGRAQLWFGGGQPGTPPTPATASKAAEPSKPADAKPTPGTVTGPQAGQP